MEKRIILFASGSGTNVENIIHFFRDHQSIRINLVISNKKNAGVITRAENLGIPVQVAQRRDFYENGTVMRILQKHHPDLIVLAGFLWLLPQDITRTYSRCIINIHPALLPKYGGKGMYGDHVHHAVKANGERETGISIHYVNERYDEGSLIAQVRVQLNGQESTEAIAQKVHRLEYLYYPLVIEDLLFRD